MATIKQLSTLLIVDDKPDNLFILQRVILQHLPQCETVTACSAQEGLEVAAMRPLDGALIDVQMPGMDGVEMCRRLKADPRTAHVPTILITSHRSRPKERAEGLEAGADDFISRPIDNIELVARINTILRMKRAEDHLRAGNADLAKRVAEKTAALCEYKRAVEDSQDLISVVNKEYLFSLVNDAFLKYHSLERNQVVGHRVSDILGKEEFDKRIKIQLDQVLRGEIVQSEIAYKFPKLGSRYMHIYRAPLKGAGDEIERVVNIVRDITEYHRAEEAHLESEKKYRKLLLEFQTVLDGIPDALILFSADKKIIWANKGVARLLNRAVDNLPGKSCHELWHDGSAPCAQCLVSKSFYTGRTEEGKEETADGRVWGVKAFPLKSREGEVTSVFKMASDITEKIFLREENTRASRLAAVGELAAGVAHEINNPNGIIQLNLSFFKDAYADVEPILDSHFREHGDFIFGGLKYSKMHEEMPHLLSEALDSTGRIKQIVEDLKDFARSDNADLNETVDLNSVLRAAVRLIDNQLKKSTSRFVSRYGENLPDIRGNSQRIEQVVVNLLMNACQALPSKEKGIVVSTFYDSARGENVLEVRDEGVGIDSEHLSQITDPFFTTRRKTGGTGLGLSVSARIVKEHGGTLRFSSFSGKGTTVTLALPICQEDEAK